MKLRNKLAAITAAAMLAFTGVGFAAWTFTQERSANVNNITDKVAVGIELNDDFVLYNADDDAPITALYLICDAPSDRTDVLAGEGVYWSTSATGKDNHDNKLAVTDVYLKGTITKVAEDSVWDKDVVDVAFTATHNLSSTYITFGSFAAIANSENVSTVNGGDVQSDDFALPTVTYLSVPTNTGELTTMNTTLATELSGKALSFTAKIVA